MLGITLNCLLRSLLATTTVTVVSVTQPFLGERKIAKFFGFAITDSMFPETCEVSRKPLTVDEVREKLVGCEMCLNPSHKPTIEACVQKYGFEISIPATAPKVALKSGDSVVVMSVRGLPRLGDRHEYTAEEIASATFSFGEWVVH